MIVQPPNVSIILPTTGRPARAAKCLQSILDTVGDRAVEIIAVVDADVTTVEMLESVMFSAGIGTWPRLSFDVSNEYRGNVAAWNSGLAQALGTYIVFAADDLTFHPGWLEESLKVMATLPDGIGLVGFNDGHWNGNELATHYIMHRQFIIEVLGGVIAWEWYKHSFNDLETNARAKRAGRFAWAEKAMVTHDHWTYGTRERDATDDRWLPDYSAAQRMYAAREAAGFPNDYPPVIGPARDKKVRVGWLADIAYQYRGGAEMVSDELLAAVPDWAEIVPCPAGAVVEDVDVYVVQNCFQYHADIIPLLEKKPVIKMIHDVWPHGDVALRFWLLDHAKRLVMVSELQLLAFGWQLSAPITFIPPPVDLAPFRAAAQAERSGAVWLGRLFPGKGLKQALAWAEINQTVLDFYGYGPDREQITGSPWARYCGEARYEDVPEILGRYKTFVFLPDGIDTFSRTTAEAFAAGCELVINSNVGAVSYLQNGTLEERVEHAPGDFWALVREVVG